MALIPKSQREQWKALCDKEPAEPHYIAPCGGLGVARWSINGWTRSTSIADEVEGGPFRMEGPTKRAAESVAQRLNAVPALLAENDELRRMVREAVYIARRTGALTESDEQDIAELAREAEE